jgi:hypothetical protein
VKRIQTTPYEELVCLNDTRFSEGRGDVEDKRSGHPVTMKTDENVEKVRTLGRTDRLGIRMTAEEVNMDTERARRILRTNLNMKNVCAKMVPKNPPFLAIKQIATLKHAPYHQTLPHVTFLFSQN